MKNISPTGSANYHNAINPTSRNLIRSFGVFSCAYVILIFIVNDSLNLFWGIILVVAGLVAIFWCTRGIAIFFTPLIFTLYYFCGYLLSLTDVMQHIHQKPFVGHESIGSFNLTNSDFHPVVITACVGIAAIICSSIISESVLWRFGHSSKNRIDTMFEILDYRKLRNLIIIWFIASIILIFALSLLEIGMIGLKGRTVLPYKIGGALVFARNALVPAVGFLLLNLSVIKTRYRLTFLTLFFLLFLAFIGGVAGMSRAYIMSIALPLTLYLIFFSFKKRLLRRILFLFLPLALFMTLFSLKAINAVRNFAYEVTYLTPADSYHVIKNLSPGSLSDLVGNFLELATGAVGGVREVMATTSSQIKDLYAPWAIFITDAKYLDSLTMSVFHFMPRTDEVRAFGTAFNLWGMFSLSGSYALIFFGSLISYMIVIFIEYVFLKRGLPCVAMFFSVYLSLRIWRNIYFYLLVRDILMVLLFYVIMGFILKWLFRRSRSLIPTSFSRI